MVGTSPLPHQDATRPERPPDHVGASTGLLRRADLDWLRVLAVLLLVPFHAALIFTP